MQAIEFQAILHDGIVAIPSQYLSQWEGKTIRVILLDDDASLPLLIEQSTVQSITEQPQEASSLLSRLKQIKISGPADFSENLDAYLNGEREV